MSTENTHSNPDPAPLGHRLRPTEGFFALFGGPIAWFIQLCVGYALASQPCFVNGERMSAPHFAVDWTWPTMVSLLIAAIVVALLSCLISWRAFSRTRAEAAGDHRHVMEVGAGRTRFMALWGVILGAGFAIATVLTAAGFLMLPRCAG